jgi:pSer/pThr/pTyr-binding forkhead associated (FHA) protein
MTHVKKLGSRLWPGLLGLVLAALIAGSAVAQTDPELRITDVDLSDFPTVGVRLLTRDGASNPIPDLSGLVLRENRAPIPEFELARVPTGIDLVLVIDANDTILLTDETDGPTRRDKVAASVESFARGFMNPTGLDRVTIITPDEGGTGVAVPAEDLSSPQAVAEAVAGYQPAAPPRITPLNDMLVAALDHLAVRRDDGRFQAVLLYTDGARLDQQLAYQDLTVAAQQAGVPFFGAILGATADDNEVAALQRLAGPTRGQVVHMPDPAATDPFFRLFQSQGTQAQARYRSLLRRGGEAEVSAALGNVRAEAAFTLALEQPRLTLDIPNAAITRVGSAIDTPLPLLQPAVLPLTATITWPDGLRRDLTEFAFLVDGRRQPLAATIAPDAEGHIPLAWDISNTDVGAYVLQVQARDVLGYEMSSAPQTVTIAVERPKPPTPTPVPTVVPVPSLTLPGNISPDSPLLWLLPVALAALVVAVWLAVRRARAGRAKPQAGEPPPAPPPPPPPDNDNHVPILQRLAAGGAVVATTILTERDTLIGRDPEAAALLLDDPTVARLHARLRQTGPAEFWLYDEGSASGTFLNHTRLGLAPRPVQHGDHLQFGRVGFRFTLQRPTEVTPPDDPGADQPTAVAVETDAPSDDPARHDPPDENEPDSGPPTGGPAEFGPPTIEANKGEDPT